MRALIRSEIRLIAPLDALEHEQIECTLSWLDTADQIFRIEKPDVPPKHLISYFAVVDGDHVLLVDHINAQRWLPTGGHVDVNEHPRDTVKREAMEELGIRAKFMQQGPLFLTETETVGKTAGHTDVSLWYVLRGDRTQALTFDESEFTAVRWFHRDDMPFERSDPHLRRFMRKLYPESSQ